MTDIILRCRSCGIRFLYTDGEQRHNAQDGLEPAQVCPGCRILQGLTARRRGRVKWYTLRKGFGFVADADGRDLFVHAADLAVPGPRKLRKGQRVSYRLACTEKGERAVDVQIITTPEDE